MTIIYRTTAVDVPVNPFSLGPGEEGDAAIRIEEGAGLVVDAGVIVDRGPFSLMRRNHPDAPTETLEGFLLPGFVDLHVHLPQIRALGGLGRPLLDWLHETALPSEEAMSDVSHARAVAAETLHNLAATGTTSALVFGSHFAPAMDAFFTEARMSGLRVTSGLVLSDSHLTPQLHTTPERANAECLDLARRWHDPAQLTWYAVTPRFALSCSPELLDACGRILQEVPGLRCTSHINENLDEIEAVAALHPGARSYADVYDQHGLLTSSTVLAHDVHPTASELDLLAARGAAVAHCPTSNAALGSGMFPLRAHLEAGVSLGFGCDVGAGGGFGVLKEARQAVYLQHLLHCVDRSQAYGLGAVHALWLATRGGALAMADGSAGRLSVGDPFDAVHVRPEVTSDAAVALRHPDSPAHLVACLLTLTQRPDIAATFVQGRRIHARA